MLAEVKNSREKHSNSQGRLGLPIRIFRLRIIIIITRLYNLYHDYYKTLIFLMYMEITFPNKRVSNCTLTFFTTQ